MKISREKQSFKTILKYRSQGAVQAHRKANIELSPTILYPTSIHTFSKLQYKVHIMDLEIQEKSLKTANIKSLKDKDQLVLTI